MKFWPLIFAAFICAALQAGAQYTDPSRVLPTLPNKPATSGTLTSVAPATSAPITATPTDTSAKPPAEALEFKPTTPQPLTLQGQPLPASPNQPAASATGTSIWERSTTVPAWAPPSPAQGSSVWDNKPAQDLWNPKPAGGTAPQGIQYEWK